MALSYRRVLFGMVALAILLSSSIASAKLYQLDYCWYGELPTYPAHIVLNVYDGDSPDPANLKGTSSMDFEWFGTYGENWNFVYDDVAFLNSAWVEDGMLKVCFNTFGWFKSRFKAKTTYEVIVNGESSWYSEHTSCSEEILFDTPIEGQPGGTFYVTNGVGCLPSGQDCPPDECAFELAGEFRMPIGNCVPDLITFNVYEGHDDLMGTSTATWTGSGLENIVCDFFACLTDAYQDGDWLYVTWEAYGYQDSGCFGSSTTFEVDLGACGQFLIDKLHTDCAEVIRLNIPHGLDIGVDGLFVLTAGCGACMVDIPIAVEESNWSTFKSLY